MSERPPPDMYVEEGEQSDEQDVTITDPDQSLSEEQTYRKTMRGFGRIWAGHTSQTLTLLLPRQMTTLLPALNFRSQGKCRFNSPQMNGFAGSSVN